MSNCKLNVICDVKKALALNSFQNEILPVSIKNQSVLLSFHIEYLFLNRYKNVHYYTIAFHETLNYIDIR